MSSVIDALPQQSKKNVVFTIFSGGSHTWTVSEGMKEKDEEETRRRLFVLPARVVRILVH